MANDKAFYFNGTSHNLNISGTITTANASSWNQYAVCYLSGGTLGHCTNAVNATGGCTCSSN